jgi:serine/threonine protein kinase
VSDPASTPTAQPYNSGHVANVAAAMADMRDPAQVGPYHVLERIGEGGMGIVYRAQQREPIQRLVAIKLIKLGMDTRQVIARFETERQALAMMSHPNVARVLDAGATDTGRPYFVMEFVKGEPITTFADRHKLTTRQRLELFIQACEAVQHAHQKAIIHRDIKPSNILVTLEGDKAVVKVIDFGVAKAVSQRLTERTLFTETGQLLGTPEYMSPEQAEMSGLDIDTRTDVYSLGVVLYELICGALPFDSRTLRSGAYSEIQRVIREVDPPRPSTRLSSLGDRDAQDVASRRQTQLQSLHRELRSELEWIPLMALRKDRAQRYASPSDLAADVRNYLESRPLRAGPESATYRMRKFLRRNKAGVAASAAMLFLLIAGISATSWQAIRATRAERHARQQQREAELANAKTTAVNDFLVNDLLASASPEVARGRTTSVRDALDTASATVARSFADQPLIEAAVRNTLASTYHSLGVYDVALQHAEHALAVRHRELGADHAETLNSAGLKGMLLLDLGRAEEAEPIARDVLDRTRRARGDDHGDTIIAIGNYAHVLHTTGRFDEAEELYREAAERGRRALGADDERTIGAINNLAGLLMSQGRSTEAEPLFREAMEQSRRVRGDDHPETLTAISNLAFAMQAQKKHADAEPLFHEAVATSRRVLGNDHPSTITTLRNLGGLYHDLARLDDAQPLYREALDSSRRVLGADHPQTIGAMNNMASLLLAQGKLAEAEAMNRDVLARCRETFGDDHPHTLMSLHNLAHALALQDKWPDAEPLYAELYRRVPQSQLDPARSALMMSRWGVSLVNLERFAEAETPLLESLKRLEETDQLQTPAGQSLREAIVKLYEATGRPEEAARYR